MIISNLGYNKKIENEEGAAANIYVTGLTDISEKLVPDGYTQLEYITATGAQYIETGIDLPLHFGFDTKFSFSSLNTEQQYISGGNASVKAYMSFSARTDGYQFYADISSGTGPYFGGTPVVNTIYTVSADVDATTSTSSYSITINDTTQTGTTSRKTSTGTMYTMRLLASGGTTPNYYCNGNLYYTRIYNSKVLIANFIPCTNSSGTVGMYDTIGETFYSSATSTAFTAGPEVVYTTSCTMTTPSGKVKEGTWGTITQTEATEVPVMTSDTTPSGTAFAKSLNDGSYAWNAFTGSVSQSYAAHSVQNETGWYIGYDFGYPVTISSFEVAPQWSSTNYSLWQRLASVLTLQGSNDGSAWTDIQAFTRTTHLSQESGAPTETFKGTVDTPVTYQMFRLYWTVCSADYSTCSFVQFYGTEETTVDAWTLHASEYGTHTVTATNGTKTSTEEVLVDALADYYVEMSLTKLYLYKYGDECTDVTGGWALCSSGSYDRHLYTNNALPLSEYSKVCIEYEYKQSITGRLILYLSSENQPSSEPSTYTGITQGDTNLSYEIPSGSYSYVLIGNWHGASGWTHTLTKGDDYMRDYAYYNASNYIDLYIYAVWLEV